MTDLVERLRAIRLRWKLIMESHPAFSDPKLLFGIDEAATALEAKDKELAALRERVKAQRDFMKELSDALISVRPLGGSELFVKRFDEYFADPAFCKTAIQQRSDNCHEAQKGLIRERRRAETAERERDDLRLEFQHAMQEFDIRNDELNKAERERDEAREALKPFAAYSVGKIERGKDFDYCIHVLCPLSSDQPMFKHFDAARAITGGKT